MFLNAKKQIFYHQNMLVSDKNFPFQQMKNTRILFHSTIINSTTVSNLRIKVLKKVGNY
jgi:hypothetical protein